MNRLINRYQSKVLELKAHLLANEDAKNWDDLITQYNQYRGALKALLVAKQSVKNNPIK